MDQSTAPRPDFPRAAKPHIPTSIVLERLIDDAPAGYVTLAWLLGHLQTRSFGIILLLLGVCGLLPVVSPVAGLMLGVPAFQMLRAHPVPVFPRHLADRPVATEKVAAMLRRIIPPLRYLERFVRPRWTTPFETTKRVIGGFVLLLGAGLFTPIPLSNIPTSLVLVLLAFAYLEQDGILLALALAITLGLFAVETATLWTTIAAMIRLTG